VLPNKEEEQAMKFTESTASGLERPADQADIVYWDDTLPGFGCRLRGSSKTWVVQYRFGRQQRRESLGDIRKVKLEDARKAARKRFAQLELGIDPGAERDAAKAAAAAVGLTLAFVADRYLAAKQPGWRRNSFIAAQRFLTKHWAPLRSMPIGAITRAMVAARLQEMTKDNGRVAAARARSKPIR
jgi:Arm DNA-binding domain